MTAAKSTTSVRSAMIDAPNLDMPAEKTGFTELSTGATFYLAQHFFTTLPEEA